MEQELIDKLLTIKETGYYGVATTLDDGTHIYASDIYQEGLMYWGYGENNRWGRLQLPWSSNRYNKERLERFIALKFPKEYQVTRDSYRIDFKNVESGEILTVNLKDKKFTKTYVNGRQRDIKYPHSFFKGMDGRIIAQKIPADDTFKTLVETIIRKERNCSNMGTFLVRLFDNIHLETYITAGVGFDVTITVPYNFFDKDVRNVLNAHNMRYTRTVEQFFANNHDLGKSMMHFIKDEEDFKSIFHQIARDMRNVNILVENYKYDVKRLFEYCKERNWSSGRWTWGGKDLINFLVDYARMAELVFPNGFDKYPKDILDHHDGVSKLYEKEKIKFDDEKYKRIIDPKMEYSNKDYCMIFPKSTGDIQEEGRILSHCVGSYVDYVIRGERIILFLRAKAEKDTPLITVEVRDNRIAQARGKYNRGLTYDEKVFLQEYAEKKKLTLDRYVV